MRLDPDNRVRDAAAFISKYMRKLESGEIPELTDAPMSEDIRSYRDQNKEMRQEWWDDASEVDERRTTWLLEEYGAEHGFLELLRVGMPVFESVRPPLTPTFMTPHSCTRSCSVLLYIMSQDRGCTRSAKLHGHELVSGILAGFMRFCTDKKERNDTWISIMCMLLRYIEWFKAKLNEETDGEKRKKSIRGYEWLLEKGGKRDAEISLKHALPNKDEDFIWNIRTFVTRCTPDR
jgi:hypothetical protein